MSPGQRAQRTSGFLLVALVLERGSISGGSFVRAADVGRNLDHTQVLDSLRTGHAFASWRSSSALPRVRQECLALC